MKLDMDVDFWGHHSVETNWVVGPQFQEGRIPLHSFPGKVSAQVLLRRL